MEDQLPHLPKGILLVHGVGEQEPGETIRKLTHGLQSTHGALSVPGLKAEDIEVAGVPLRLYEVYWADLLKGDITANTFSAKELQAFAWFPWLNFRRRNYSENAYGLGRVLGWSMLLPLVSIALALPYAGARLLVQSIEKRKLKKRTATTPRDIVHTAIEQANTTAHGRTAIDEKLDEYVGDVFNYVNSAGQARYPGGRENPVSPAIQNAYKKISLRFQEQLLKAADECDDIQILAHSLGTVISYHGLLGLQDDEVSNFHSSRLCAARKKVSHLYTIGSPLEKIRFFWPKLAIPKTPPGELHFYWDNFASWFDPVAGILKNFNHWGDVCNHRMLGGGFITGHVVYEMHPKFHARFIAGLGGSPLAVKRKLTDRFKNWLPLVGETLVTPVILIALTLVGAAIWGMTAAILPWLISLLFRPDFMPDLDPAIIDRVTLGLVVMFIGVFLLNARNLASSMHRAAWSPNKSAAEKDIGG